MSDRFTRRIYLALAEGRDLSSEEEGHLATCAGCRAAAERAREFERALDRELSELRAPMPADPFAVAEARTRSRPSGVLLLAVLVAMLTATTAGVVLLTPPGPRPDPSPDESPVAAMSPSASPSPSAPPSPVPTASPSAEPTAIADPLETGDFAILAVGELPIHDQPDGEPFALVQPGPEVYILDVRGEWYLIEEASWAGLRFGWVAATQPSDGPNGSGEQVPTLVRHAHPPCLEVEPGDPNWMGASHPQWERQCYGGAEAIVIEGYAIEVSEGEITWPYTGEPAWLAAQPTLQLSSVIGPAVSGFSVGLHLPPDLDGAIPTSDRDAHEGTPLQVTGHFDDPRSDTCAMTARVDGYPPIEAGHAELWCRQRFVVDRVEVVEPTD